jgi:hypothetical protein
MDNNGIHSQDPSDVTNNDPFAFMRALASSNTSETFESHVRSSLFNGMTTSDRDSQENEILKLVDGLVRNDDLTDSLGEIKGA